MFLEWSVNMQYYISSMLLMPTVTTSNIDILFSYHSGSQKGRGPVYRGGQVAQVSSVTGVVHPTNLAHKRPRWFVALFDYDPTNMSPNPNGCEDELPFSEGDTIKVYLISIYRFHSIFAEYPAGTLETEHYIIA